MSTRMGRGIEYVGAIIMLVVAVAFIIGCYVAEVALFKWLWSVV
jgi:hypothetical protein